MGYLVRLGTTALSLASLGLLGACATAGNLTIRNEGPSDVVVLTGVEDIEVGAGEGAAALEYGCTPGDVVVAFPSGEMVVLPGPVCPEERIVVGDGTAERQPIL